MDAFHNNKNMTDQETFGAIGRPIQRNRIFLSPAMIATALALLSWTISIARVGDFAMRLSRVPLCQGSCPLLYFSLIFRWAD
jgi:hypothetical protein